MTRESLRRNVGSVKQVNYDGGAYLVGDDMADALLDYTVLMARRDTADTVTFQALDSGGREEQVSLVLGPATMVTASEVFDDFAAPENGAALETLRQRTAALERPAHVFPDDGAATSQLDDWE
jgi:hypothetical protein